MYSHRKFARRFSFLLSPGGIVFGYLFTLFAVVAGMGAFPFSRFWLGLLFVVVGAFFVVAVSVLVIVYLFFAFAFLAALVKLGRRFLFGADRSQTTNKPFFLRKDLENQRSGAELWDRWVDG